MAIDGLANDIAHNGQLQPVVVRIENDTPAVIAGQRRRKALLRLEKANNKRVIQTSVALFDVSKARVKCGIVSNQELRKLEKQATTDENGGTEIPTNEKLEVTKKLNEYWLGYLTGEQDALWTGW